MGIKTISSPASPCSGWKAGPVTRPDTLRVAPGGPRIVLTLGRAEPVGRSVAASPVESFGLWLTSASTSTIQEHSFQSGGFCPWFRNRRCCPAAGLLGVEERFFRIGNALDWRRAEDAVESFLGSAITGLFKQV